MQKIAVIDAENFIPLQFPLKFQEAVKTQMENFPQQQKQEHSSYFIMKVC